MFGLGCFYGDFDKSVTEDWVIWGVILGWYGVFFFWRLRLTVDIERHGVESWAGNAKRKGDGVKWSRARGGGGCIYVVNIASVWHGKVNLF